MKFNTFIKKLGTSKKPLLAVLIDPDKFNLELIHLANKSNVACFLVGGSIITEGNISSTVKQIKVNSKLPVILFPGDETQLTPLADGLFLPSLLSGRNPDYLIGKHIIMAPLIKSMKLQSVPMAYLLINDKKTSRTQQVTQTIPLHPKDKKLILNTVLAAELLGFKLIYLEAGSGSNSIISADIIKFIKKKCSLPIIVGGGIDSIRKVKTISKTGANMIVVGNALEKNVYLLSELNSYF